MIEQIIDNEGKKIRFVFTNSHIYNYADSYIESFDNEIILNFFIKYYHDEKKREVFKEIIKDFKYGDIIIDSIDKMISNEPVIYEEDLESYIKGDGYGGWFNTLYLNQNS